MAVDIGQAIVSPLELVGELFMIDTETMEHRGVQVIHVHRVFGDIK